MPKVTYQVEFSGHTTVEINTDNYPHYFEQDEIRGGESQLIKDLFYDNADLRDNVFQEGGTEFFLEAIEKYELER
jgi:hypothetical protein